MFYHYLQLFVYSGFSGEVFWRNIKYLNYKIKVLLIILHTGSGSETGRFVKALKISAVTIYSYFLQTCNPNEWK